MRSHWDGKAAAKYLDARAAEWAKFGGANRGQGADKVSCVSCHTMLSYALGRPAARHLEGENQPTAQEDRMLEHVRRRVANWKELDTPRFQLSYDFDEKEEGRVVGHRVGSERLAPVIERPSPRPQGPERFDARRTP